MEIAILALVPVLAVLAAATWVLWQILRGLRFLVVGLFRLLGMGGGRLFRFVRAEVVEVVQFLGAGVTLAVLLPMTAVNFAIGRWSTARHYGKAIEDEFVSGALGLYRIALGHPLRLVGLGAALEGLERRLPDVVDRAPRPARTAKDALEFPGYRVVGTLPAGGSGAQLYLARPLPETFDRFREKGRPIAAEVVIKAFDLVQGSTLPQIVRESRALEAANRLGLVYEHSMDPDRFFYVMRYERGENLDSVIQRLHARSSPEGLGRQELRLVLGYAGDLLRSLDRFHTGGLWHKDVKPANLIISGEEAHLVDFGLVTPLQSALTLTTHGTEYYRDPEMVRLAMQGVKVHEVDGVKFDLYSAGAVLYSMVENSFPAHGSLSQVTKRCPEALAWVIRRSMADIDSRYGSAWEMLDDLETLARAADPFALRPADLPSLRRGDRDPRPRPEETAARRPGLAARVASLFPGAARGSFAGGDVRPPSLPPEVLAARDRVRAGLDASRLRGRGARREARRVARACSAAASSVSGACRRKRRRMLAGAALFFVTLAGVAATIDRHGRRSWSESQRVVHSARAQAELSEVLARDDYTEAQREAVRLAARLLAGRRGASEAQAGAPAPPNGPAAWATPSLPPDRAEPEGASRAPEDGRRMYLLDDPFRPAAPEVLAEVRDSLAERGFRLYGEDDMELSAELRLSLGSSSLGDEQAKERLQAFLDRSTELDAILWLAASQEDEQAEFEYLVRSVPQGSPSR